MSSPQEDYVTYREEWGPGYHRVTLGTPPETPPDLDDLIRRLAVERDQPEPPAISAENGDWTAPRLENGYWWSARGDDRAVWLGGGWHHTRYLLPEALTLLTEAGNAPLTWREVDPLNVAFETKGRDIVRVWERTPE